MRLTTAPFSAAHRIRHVHGADPVVLRLMEMGLVEGAEVKVIGRAPLGDPLRLRVGEFDMSLRTREAELIEVG